MGLMQVALFLIGYMFCLLKSEKNTSRCKPITFLDLGLSQSSSIQNQKYLGNLCSVNGARYLLYDVNPGEGFNLRRDVFLRLSHLIRIFNAVGYNYSWVLVLPPWGNLYHWKNERGFYPWKSFFDLASVQRWIDVIDMEEFIQGNGPYINIAFVLQNFVEGWGDKFEEKYEIRSCVESNSYRNVSEKVMQVTKWGIDFEIDNFSCLSFQGQTSTLVPLLNKDFVTRTRYVMVDRAEVLLHDEFGGIDYWAARRSMRFAHHLLKEAERFRREFLNSDDERDKTVVPDDWRTFKPRRGEAIGGPYLAVHLRRRDFIYGRSNEVPTIAGAATQLRVLLLKLKLKTLFVASDGSHEELGELRGRLKNFTMHTYKPTPQFFYEVGDGGVAIVDQIICSHARPEDLLVNELWNVLTADNLLKLEEMLTYKRMGSIENAMDAIFTRDEFVKAIAELFGSNSFSNAANLVFTSALSCATAENPTSAMSSSSAQILTAAAPFTAFKSSISSIASSSSSSSVIESIGHTSSGVQQTVVPGGSPGSSGSPVQGSLANEEIEDVLKWSDILQQFFHLAKREKEKESVEGKQILCINPKYFALPYIKRERVKRIEKLEPQEKFLVIGENGTLCILDNRFNSLNRTKLSVTTSSESNSEQVVSAAKYSHVSDLRVTCSSALGQGMMLIGTTSEDLHCLKYSKVSDLLEILCIIRLPSFPTALHARIEEDSWWIAVGTNAGSVYFLKSNHNFESLLARADRDKKLIWKEAFEKFGFVEHHKCHKAPVLDLFYDTQTDTLVSCSEDPKVGLLVTRPYSSAQKYAFSIPQGVRAMATGWKLHLIATICGDSVVRTWNPFVVKSPLMELPPSFSHDPPISLFINEDKALLIVLFIDAVIMVWSVDSCNPLQSVYMKIPGGQKWNPLSKPMVVLNHRLLIFGENHFGAVQFVDRDRLTPGDEFDGSVSDEMSCHSDDFDSRVKSPTVDSDEEDWKGDRTYLSPSLMGREPSSKPTISLDRKKKDKMKKLVRSGAPFSCLKLFQVKKGSYIPEGLPLPRYLSALDVPSNDSRLIIEHVRPPTKRDSLFLATMMKAKDH